MLILIESMSSDILICNMAKKFLFFICLLLGTRVLAGNHIIIAFDEAGTSWRLTDDRVRTSIEEMLFDNDGSPLFSEGDYLSVVGVKGDTSSERWDDFVYIKKAYETNYQEVRQMFSVGQWRQLVKTPHRYDYEESYSLISIAKPYILSVFGKLNPKPLVERTFIIFITDHRYNGNDYYNELQYFLGQPDYVRKKIDIYDVLQVCYDVEREYCIEYKDVIKWPFASHNGKYRNVELFEVCPNQEYLTLPAVIDYSPSVTAVRKKGKKYELELYLKHSNPHFDLKELIVYKCSETKKTEEPIDTLYALDEYVGTYVFDRVEAISSLKMMARLKLNDGIYNGTVLTPKTVVGLEQHIIVNIEEDSKILFGLAPLPDWLWISSVKNQQAAAIIISFIILILCIMALVTYVLVTKTYRPKNEEVRIKFYD